MLFGSLDVKVTSAETVVAEKFGLTAGRSFADGTKKCVQNELEPVSYCDLFRYDQMSEVAEKTGVTRARGAGRKARAHD